MDILQPLQEFANEIATDNIEICNEESVQFKRLCNFRDVQSRQVCPSNYTLV